MGKLFILILQLMLTQDCENNSVLIWEHGFQFSSIAGIVEATAEARKEKNGITNEIFALRKIGTSYYS
jgi:hypothetical protein